MIDETSNTAANEERVGFCQDCGRPLTAQTIRRVGSGVFCEQCLEIRMAAGTVPPPVGAVPPPPVTGVPPIGASDPSPVLAALLGFIPGVGAMYNGQFAKGIAHFVIFALLEALTNVSHSFGILIMGWVFYQVFDAYYTAKARREGTPLPDPLGLNNIGVHVGEQFRQDAARRAAQAGPIPNAGNPYTAPNWAWGTPQPAPVPPAAEQPVQAWASVPPPPVSPYAQSVPVPPPVAPPSAPWTPPIAQNWAPVAGGSDVAPAPRRSSIPGAAAWLIGLGIIFTVLNVMPEWRFSVHKIFPFLVMAFAVWLFVRRMLFSGGVGPVEGEGEGYVARVVGFLRAPVVTFSVGLLWMLQEFHVVRMTRSWPILLIVIGVLLMIERSVGGRVLPTAPMSSPVTEEKGI